MGPVVVGRYSETSETSVQCLTSRLGFKVIELRPELRVPLVIPATSSLLEGRAYALVKLPNCCRVAPSDLRYAEGLLSALHITSLGSESFCARGRRQRGQDRPGRETHLFLFSSWYALGCSMTYHSYQRVQRMWLGKASKK